MAELERSEERMPVKAALEVGAAVASALDAAYNRPPIPGDKPLRVIHRDIKPSNLMLDDTGLVKVLDFGVARSDLANRESHTQELQFGSVDYMPPERLFFEPETPASDVYSLGATLFEILALEKLGKAKGRPERHAAFIRDRASVLSAHYPAPNVEAVEQLIVEMLAFSNDQRPAASDLVQRCRQLARTFDGDGLTEWAELVIPPLVKAQREEHRESNPLTDSILTEDSGFLGSSDAPWRPNESNSTVLVGVDDPVPEVPRHDSRWELLREAARSELATRAPEPEPAPASEFDDDGPTRISIGPDAAVARTAAPPAPPVPPPPPVRNPDGPASRSGYHTIGGPPAPAPVAPPPAPAAPVPPPAPAAPVPVPVPVAAAPAPAYAAPSDTAYAAEAPPKKGKAGLIIGILVGLVVVSVLGLGVLVGGYYAFFTPKLDDAPVASSSAPSAPGAKADAKADATADAKADGTPAAAAVTGPLRFVSAAPETAKLKVDCDGTKAEGEREVGVALERAKSCYITVHLKDRSRINAQVTDATEGVYTCFVSGAKECTR